MTENNDDSNGLFGSAEKLRKELERLLEKAKDQGEKALDAIGLRGGTWQPPVNLTESTEEVCVSLDVPGMTSEQLSLEIVGNMLTITGTRPEPQPAPGEIVHLRQRPTGSFERSIPLPVPVDHEKVTAEVHHGVLTIRVAKAERAKTHKVPINERPSNS